MFMEKLRAWLEEYGGEEEITNFLEGNYFCDCGSCVSDDWVGDDLNDAISTKFYYPYRAAADCLFDETGISFSIYIIASYEDVSVIIVTARDNKDEDFLILKDFRKAWRFNFNSESELEEDMQSIYDMIKGNAKKKGLIEQDVSLKEK